MLAASRTPRSTPSLRTLVAALSALAVTVAVTFAVTVALAPPSRATSGASPVGPAARAEIERVVGQGLGAGGATGRSTGRSTGRGKTGGGPASARALVSDQVRCAAFEGLRYCLHVGWTDAPLSRVATRAMREAARDTLTRARGIPGEATTGDQTLLARLRAVSRMSPSARAAAERAELTAASRAVAKVWLLRHQVEGLPLPAGFLRRHPEVRVTGRGWQPGTTVKSPGDFPAWDTVLHRSRTSEQRLNYWCGPSAMQMIAWGWTGERRSQDHWAEQLGTTTAGTSITEMVRVTNEATGWDGPRRAGPYVALDVSWLSFYRWWMLNMRHIHDYRAPLIYHPILVKEFYPYLDDDASGHFQVGRGYSKNGPRPPLVSFFEPYNQQRFDPSEPYVPRVQWRSAYRSYRANQEHFQHNIGV